MASTRLRRIALVALAGAGSFAGTLVLSSDLLLHSSTAAIIPFAVEPTILASARLYGLKFS